LRLRAAEAVLSPAFLPYLRDDDLAAEITRRIERNKCRDPWHWR
jgi:hypothetical protein